MPLSAGQIMQYGEQEALNAIFLRVQSPTAGSVYLALLTSAPAAGTDLTMAVETEYGAVGYARQTMAVNVATAASPSTVANSSTLTFGPFVSGTGATVTWGMCVDASIGTSANNIVSYLVTIPRTPLVGDSLQAAISAFTCQV